jgi:LPXTG-motif cell wall-anchored protein
MRRTSLAVVVAVATIMVFSLMLVPLVGATSVAAPALQTTTTAVGTEAATSTLATAAATEAATTTAATAAATEAATTTAATAAATEAATTTAATPTRAPSTLPNTGGDSGMSALLLGPAALVLIGVAAALLLGRRRDTTV